MSWDLFLSVIGFNNVDRRLISFDRDIIDEVVSRSGGKFTKGQVEWCMKASVSYIHHLARYTDNISIRIPFIGNVICNLREMRVRRDKLLRIRDREGGWPDDRMPIELDCLNDKIKVMEDLGNLKEGDPMIRDNHASMYNMRHGLTWEELQDFQQQQFKRR